MPAYIEPRVLKGFRDFLPSAEIARRELLELIESSFRSFGFVPIDTPALEYAEILLGKGGGETEKQIYRFRDNGERDVALRFDLTVPFARFMAEHRQELPLPFKRYHIGKAWRGENTQRGRYREFIQCDFDIVGSVGAASDFEILLMMRNTLKLLGAGDVCIHLNHRGLFNRFLGRLEASQNSVEILRIVDKLSKTGREEILKQLSDLLDETRAREVLRYIEAQGSFDEILKVLTEAAAGNNSCAESERLALIRRFMVDTGTEDSFVLDPSITRGLDYYTGVVYESFLGELPEIGSVCSGGRYDNLVGLYTKSSADQNLPGVGASIGIDRLIAALEALGRLKTRSAYARIAIACIHEEDSGRCQALAEKLRAVNIPCEVFPDEAKLPKQFMLGEKKGVSFIVIPHEGSADTITLRNLETRENQELPLENLISFLKEKL